MTPIQPERVVMLSDKVECEQDSLDSDILATAKDSLREAILAALKTKYISVSSHEGLKTGNHYQSIQLGDELVEGFREGRSELFQVFDFSGCAVLDCGCNIGEMSRLARKRGAILVDGYEYDHYFVEMARMISAYNGTTRVSYYQKDLTNPATFKDQFDVALAFSVFPYIEPVLKDIDAVVKDALILETHNIKPQLYETYIEALRPYFPFHTFVTTTFHGKGQGQRAVLVFARTEAILTGGLLKSTIDIEKSNLGPIEEVVSSLSGIVSGQESNADRVSKVLATGWGQVTDELRWALTKPTYWRLMLEGYVHYQSEGSVTDGNPYLPAFMVTLEGDAELRRRLPTPETIRERALWRFKDMDVLSAGEDATSKIPPVKIFDIGLSSEERRFAIRHGEFEQDVFADTIDGYHRLFWAKFFGVRKLNALYLVEKSLGNSGGSQ